MLALCDIYKFHNKVPQIQIGLMNQFSMFVDITVCVK